MSKKLKIAYILNRFPYLTETFILREMVHVRELGQEVHIFSLLPPLATPVHQQAREMMPYVHYSPFLLSGKLILAQLFFLLHSPIRYARALARAVWQTYREPLVLLRVLAIFPKSVYFARQMQELQIDHIHAHYVWVNGVAAKVVSDLIGVTTSLHPHAFGLFSRERESVRRQLELSDGVVTVSEYHRQCIADLCPRWSKNDIEIVHYGLDPTEFTPARVPAAGDTVRILSVGSLVEKKGHEFLIDACALLAEQGVTFRCSIVGIGPLESALEARIDRNRLQGRVSLLGPKTQAEVRDLYRHSDIFALACIVAKNGDRDGMPNVLLEAMAMQIPVVTTPVAGIVELVRHEKTGLLVPEKDAVALAHALDRLVHDGFLRRELGGSGHQAVLDGFDIRHTARKTADFFCRLKTFG